MERAARTLKKNAEFEGVALHSGDSVRVRLEPAPAGTGIVFRRSDLDDGPDVPALPSALVTSNHRTVLREGPAEVGMVEHLLSACNGLGVDNLIVCVSGSEMPGMDGSALPYVAAMQKAGLLEQKLTRKVFRVIEPVVVREGDAEILVLPPSGDELRVRYLPTYPAEIDDSPFEFFLTQGAFESEVAPARTFVVASEIEALLAAGYGKGATAENTVVLGGDTPAELRMPCEPTRHKVLDLLGDFALLGVSLHADIIATRSGHALNQAAVRRLREQLDDAELAGEVMAQDGYDIRDVMRLLPHRYPFLLVDRVIEVEGFRRAVGIKNVTINEPFFEGHFPDQPLMPGVLQLEALAQLSGFLLQRKLEHTGKTVVLAAIDKVRFRGGVTPGDQLRLEVETLRMSSNRGTVKA
ncbi:MAG: UDP-3-O-[3-hydroxymyristoyl] N-acetylglucosamine deacetylase, partial [Planctomycetes bacterium]|nr:UDP-3-O-[3-hydroxymyristoyl] N-acetylglucosamine deacetylase [Planctomycetota bacterium]